MIWAGIDALLAQAMQHSSRLVDERKTAGVDFCFSQE
jgi:hypothetical protein